MSRELSHPYRAPAPRGVSCLIERETSIERALLLARRFLLVWSFARAVVGATCGMDFESYAAIVIAVAAARSSIESVTDSPKLMTRVRKT